MPPGEKRFGEQCQISWAYSKKVASTNEIISHYKALPIQLYVFFLSTGVSRTSFRWEGGDGRGAFILTWNSQVRSALPVLVNVVTSSIDLKRLSQRV